MIRKSLQAGALAVALALGSGGFAVAQQETPPAVQDTAAQVDRGFDWGWLGLLGLIGLFGLAGARRRSEPVRTTTTGTVR